MTVHVVHEDNPWSENVPSHATRADSPTYTAARKYMIAAVNTIDPWFFGAGPWEDHHGGAVWLRDPNGWFLVKNTVGLEWSSQFCLDPAKLDTVRRNAERLVAGFPMTENAYQDELGMSGKHLGILHTPIVTPDDIAAYVDSFWNASLPIPKAVHTGTLGPGKSSAGVHHYPSPITDIQHVKQDDFQLFVLDPTSGKTVAVAPVAPRGAGDARVKLLYHPDDPHAEGTVVDSQHPIAKAAYARQG